MALADSYVQTYGQLAEVFKRISEGQAPDKFTRQHLKDLGFASSNFHAVIPLLKTLGFLAPDGSPTSRYHAYRDHSRSRVVLGEALREAYGDLFTIKANPTSADRQLIAGKFKSAHNTSERVAQLMASTFYSLLALADIHGPTAKASSGARGKAKVESEADLPLAPPPPVKDTQQISHRPTLHYNIQIHLPRPKTLKCLTPSSSLFGSTSLTSRHKDLRDFMFRGLMFESEAASFQAAGIQVGADVGEAEERLLSEALSPFGVVRRNHALEMARLYAVLHCFENEVRSLIRETLQEKEGTDWLDKLPTKVKQFADSRQKAAMADSWLEGEKSDTLGFVDFGQLSQIIIDKWQCFEDIVPSQHWLKQRMDELEKVRHFIAHNRALLPSEFARIYMYIADWNRVVGL